MKKLALVLIAFIVVVTIPNMQQGVRTGSADVSLLGEASSDSGWHSGSQVTGTGTVERVLSDDNDGSRHQRFILNLSSGRTVLIAHNIDLAPRLRSLAEGDEVSFFGQFETNDRGGVIHWTHKDPQGQHLDGWLEHRGQRYQ